MSTVLIRDAKLSDAPRLLEIYSYYVKNTAITFEYNVPSLEEFRHRMKNITLRYPYIVLEADGKVMGYAYAGSFIGRAAYDWSCEMTVYLDRTAKKLGFGRKIYEAMEQRLKDMGILNLYACIGYIDKEDEYLNHNSADFHAHLGYKTVGTFKKCGYKFGRWYDMIWMEKCIGPTQTRIDFMHPIPYRMASSAADFFNLVFARFAQAESSAAARQSSIFKMRSKRKRAFSSHSALFCAAAPSSAIASR